MMNSLELPRPPFPGLLGSQPDDAVHFACVNACKHGSKSRNQVWINEWSCDGICRLEIAGLTGVDVGMWSIYPYRGDGHCWRAADSGGADTGIDGCIHHREYRPAGHPTLQHYRPRAARSTVWGCNWVNLASPTCILLTSWFLELAVVPTNPLLCQGVCSLYDCAERRF